jgi:(1->4)-alpha-D-glucan 1-alpha-D-glucosylmutase
VDYGLRRQYLADLREHLDSPQPDRLAFAQHLLEHADDGRIKQLVVHCALRFRRDHPNLFAQGSYVPLEAAGAKSAHVVAFLRGGDDHCVVIVPRLLAQLTDGVEVPPLGESVWGDTSVSGLPAGRYENRLTGEELTIGADGTGALLYVRDALRHIPVALLVSRSP